MTDTTADIAAIRGLSQELARMLDELDKARLQAAAWRQNFDALQHALVGETGASGITVASELRKDAERMDWLDENPESIRRSTGYRGSASCWSVRGSDGVTHDFISARNAIDAAMKDSE